MGVEGLWKIVEPTARPIRLESLGGQRVAVDASLWLYHFLKAMRDSQGNLAPNAPLLGFFRRVAKLLFYNIRPVFVFDGGVPAIKRSTIAARRARKEGMSRREDKTHQRVLNAKLRKFALAQVEAEQGQETSLSSSPLKPCTEKGAAETDEYALPPTPTQSSGPAPQPATSDPLNSDPDDELDEETAVALHARLQDDNIDIDSEAFRSLPIDIQQEILTELRVRSRQPNWNRLHEIIERAPTALDFSRLQIKHLVRRNDVWLKLEKVQKRAVEWKDMKMVESRRIAAEQDREYMLVKHTQGGTWTMVQKGGDEVEEESVENVVAAVEERPQHQFLEDSGDSDDLEQVFSRPQPAPSTESALVPPKPTVTLLDALYQQWIALSEDRPHLRSYFHDCIYTRSLEDLRSERTLVEKRRGKLSASDQVNIDELEFQLQFLEDVLDVRRDEVSTTMVPPEEILAVEKDEASTETMLSVRAAVTPESIASEVVSSEEKPARDSPVFVAEQKTVKLPEPLVDAEELLPAEPFLAEDKEDEVKAADFTPDLLPEQQQIGQENEGEELQQQAVVTESSRQEQEEFARFLADVSQKPIAEVEAALSKELDTLRDQYRREKRDASSVTSDMIQDVQELLQLFGIPYITAPMEAEAQCAELLRLKLVDAIVTDDSDVFLFGGSNVLRNLFSQARFVEIYTTEDLQAEMGLTRDRLIQLAYLLGSDYTEGIKGVGGVTAMEIVSEWTGEQLEGLRAFSRWWEKVIHEEPDPDENPFRLKFRKAAKKLVLNDTFPEESVSEAYLHPSVNDSPEKFVWGFPNLERLRDYLQVKFGWEKERVDGLLVPVIRNLSKGHREQNTLDRYFPRPQGARTIVLGDRMRKVVEKWKALDKSQLRVSPHFKRDLDLPVTTSSSEASPPLKTRKRRKANPLRSLKDLYEKSTKRGTNSKRKSK